MKALLLHSGAPDTESRTRGCSIHLNEDWQKARNLDSEGKNIKGK